jgi:pimeloyl-ACP methyl ester carboxylesterase
MGGVVAMSYASQFPNHPCALILCNTEAKIFPEARRQAFYQIGGGPASRYLEKFDHFHDNDIIRKSISRQVESFVERS